jgi:DNA-binding NtrC family response regulator
MKKKQDIMGTDKTILIAEPTGTLLSELESFLLSEGIACIQAKTVQETLLTIQNQQTDTLVLDAVLLGEDCSFISVIKNMAKNLPIILCAETNTPEFESRVRQERIFFYHIKSFGSQDLKMAISNAINKLPH